LAKGFNPQPQSPIKPLTFNNALSNNKRAFTLIELIVVIIIVGVLAALGISQYSITVEKSRLAEARVRIGTMRQLAYQYYLENGSVTGMLNADVGVDNTCVSTDYYRYFIYQWGTSAQFNAVRCDWGGKTPNVRSYMYSMYYVFGSGEVVWHCHYTDGSPCFGLPY